jgi:hypothetical protein
VRPSTLEDTIVRLTLACGKRYRRDLRKISAVW